MQVCFARIYIGVVIFALVSGAGIIGTASAAGSDIVGTRIILPSTLGAGDTVEIQDFIRNQGASGTGMFQVHYYLSPDPSASDSGTRVGSWEISGIKSGALKSGNTTLSIPGTMEPGKYYLVRKIDPEGVLSGEYTANNIQRSKNPVSVIQHYDKGVRGVSTTSPPEAVAGDLMPVSVLVENTNDAESAPVPVYFFLSPSEIPGSSKISAGSLNIDVILPGKEQEVSGKVLIPADTPAGWYYFFTSLIPPDEITGTVNASVVWFNEDRISISSPESGLNENPVSPGFNSGPGPSSSSGADIVSLESEYPGEAFIGDTFVISDMIQNNGGSAANIIRVEYGLSSDSSGKNSLHIGWWTTMNLGAGQTASEQNTVGVPAEMKPGLYYLTKKISVTALPAEENTNNNWWVSNTPIEIRYNPADPIPELTHVKTLWPGGQPGDTVQITDTITNIGKSCANGISVAYYLSPYPDFDAGTAEYLGAWNLDSICPGEQKTNAVVVTIPQPLANGEYYYYSIIDPCSFIGGCGEGIPEPDKSNNINIGTLVIGPCTFCG